MKKSKKFYGSSYFWVSKWIVYKWFIDDSRLVTRFLDTHVTTPLCICCGREKSTSHLLLWLKLVSYSFTSIEHDPRYFYHFQLVEVQQSPSKGFFISNSTVTSFSPSFISPFLVRFVFIIVHVSVAPSSPVPVYNVQSNLPNSIILFVNLILVIRSVRYSS